jgi:predicted RND superfamily exporter protein
MTSALGDTKYNELLIDLEEDLKASIQNTTNDVAKPILFRFAGIMPLVHNIQQQLLNDLFSSFLSAFAIIFAILALSLGSFSKATIAMIPNLFPIVLLFGALGWSGSAIDIGTIMTASIAIGIAVDDTLHFLTMYEKVLASPMNRLQAVQTVYQHCGLAILNTTIVCVLGMAVFSLNDFTPTARFSWMMAGLLMLAVIGDLILLPALLLSPLGYFFDRTIASALHSIPESATELKQKLLPAEELPA